MNSRKHLKSIFHNRNGMSIVGVLVATGISGVLALGVAQIMSQVFKGQAYFKSSNEIEYFHKELRARLNDRQACLNTFSPLGTYSDGINHTVAQIMNEEPAAPSVRYRSGEVYGNGAFRVESMRVVYRDGAQPNVGEGVLEVQYAPPASAGGPQLRKRLINLRMNVNPANALTSCTVAGSETDEGHWKLSPHDSEKIYYNGKGVGINTDNPIGALDVRGGVAPAGEAPMPISIRGQGSGDAAHPGGHILLNAGARSGGGSSGMVGVNVGAGVIKASFEVFSTQLHRQNFGANQGDGSGFLVGSNHQGGDAPYLGMTMASGCRNTASSLGWCASMIGVNMYYDAVGDTMRRAGTDVSGGHNVATGITMTSDSSQPGGNRMGFWSGLANSNPIEHMSLTNTGRLGIGVTSPTHKLEVAGTAGLSTGTAWTNTSDARLKDIRGSFTKGLAEILKLRTVLFSYKKDNKLGLPSDLVRTGFIAQEVQKVIPEAVTVRSDGFLELNVDPIHWASLNAVQELHQMCQEQESELQESISDLKNKNTELQDELERVKSDLEEIKRRLGI